MLERLGALELGRSRPTRSHQGLTGRIGDQMQMKIVFGLLHRILRGLLIRRDKIEVASPTSRLQGITHRVFHNGYFGEGIRD